MGLMVRVKLRQVVYISDLTCHFQLTFPDALHISCQKSGVALRAQALYQLQGVTHTTGCSHRREET
jgi:hypothetical protein